MLKEKTVYMTNTPFCNAGSQLETNPLIETMIFSCVGIKNFFLHLLTLVCCNNLLFEFSTHPLQRNKTIISSMNTLLGNFNESTIASSTECKYYHKIVMHWLDQKLCNFTFHS